MAISRNQRKKAFQTETLELSDSASRCTTSSKQERKRRVITETKKSCNSKTSASYRGKSIAKPKNQDVYLGLESPSEIVPLHTTRPNSSYPLPVAADSSSELIDTTSQPEEHTVTMNPKSTADKQPTTVYVSTYSRHKNKDAFKSCFTHILGSRFTFAITSLQINENGFMAEVQFDSKRSANRAVKEIKEGNIPDVKVSLSQPGAELRKKVVQFKESICRAKTCELYLSRCEKLSELKKKHDNLKVSKNLEECIKIEREKKAMRAEIVESELQQMEFNTYCDSLDRRVDKLLALPSGCSLERVSQMRKDIDQECARFDKGLPIYAYRGCIVDTIATNQLCILIGETGSGKSTQLVQYLYDAGFGENGVIVCTQPRKVAAITLAKHVSTEMGVAVGSILGYKVGSKGKFTKQTKVLYMTDYSLLNECIKDPLLSNYSCLIIDEAHERSIHTDVLLAFIKKCLPQRQNLKVVVTSATIDESVFRHYFQLEECPVIKVPGRVYPVDIKWNALGFSVNPIERDYILDLVDLATDIHKTEPPGDILVFLTSAAEIEQACQITSLRLKNEALVLPLHGKLQPDEQQKVFQCCLGVRKIIFATNVAETSVTIPGVKYIVDSGLAKELKFDPKKNMNSLEVSMISKSSAEQRKGRAGRTSAGKCYRMYSEDLYSTMQDMMVPEMLRVTLSHTVLKLYEFGITDILDFDFVEHPEPSALIAAIESLEFLGAVKDGKLTAVGKKMCALPIDPHFSKVLLDGIEQGVGLEAATAVAISTLGGSIFFRGGTDEMKMESDRKKISFSHPAGDQMTCLKAYFQWKSQKQSQRKKWCVDNYINYKSMCIVQDTVKELCETVTHQLHMNLPNVIANLKDAESKIPKLYFTVFIYNIAVFLGHERAGYLNEQLPDERLFVFPGSSLCQLNPIPTVVVYEKTLKTSRHFLLQLVPVREEWIQEAISDGRLSCQPTESPVYLKHKVSSISHNNLGNHTLKLLKKSQNEFEDLHSYIQTSLP